MQLEISLNIAPNIKPRAAITDKGYDSKANRAACRRRGILQVIPHRENAKSRPKCRSDRLLSLLNRLAFASAEHLKPLNLL